jgi:S-DNA-T family DNA segregation ATPase FtsK/SpoIIIE
MGVLLQRFRRDILGLAWLSTGLLLALALLTYSPADPSFNSIGHGLQAKNACGYIGSFLADLFYQGFGLASWLYVVGCGRAAFGIFFGKPQSRVPHRRLLALSLAIVVASLLALYFPTLRLWKQIPVGGLVGHLMTTGLIKALNPLGVTIFLWTMALVLVIFYTEKAIDELMIYPFGLLKSVLKQTVAGLRSTSQPASAPVTAAALPPKFFPLQAAAEPEKKTPPPFDIRFLETEKRKTSAPKISRHIENWELPKLSILDDPPLTRYKIDEREVKEKARLLTEKLGQFSVRGNVTGVKPGPAVTMFEFKPAVDVKISKITELADDLSLALSSESVRIIAPIPGRDVVGIETSNSQREGVYLKDLLSQDIFWEDDMKLPAALGRKADGEPRIVDLRKMPHLLVAGSTGSGKSVFVVSLLAGLLFRHSPKTLKLILVDPKQVDLAAFAKVPHLVMPPIREPRKAVGALRWAIREMEKRYRSMSQFGARGMEAFNEIVAKLSKDQIAEHEKINAAYDAKNTIDTYYFTELPFIVIVVEEFGDLMAVDKVNVEQAVVRLAQMARACGIHLVLAMQSPRKDVVTGLIKTNIPGRVSFKVASKMDSRIILDESGAERLLARGDMLFLAPGVSKPERHHGPFVSETELSGLVQFWQDQGEAEFDKTALRVLDQPEGSDDSGSFGDFGGEEGDDVLKDERYDEILAYVASLKEVSASLLQRKFRLGYPRAARMIEIFEAEGVIGPANGSKPRQVLLS